LHIFIALQFAVLKKDSNTEATTTMEDDSPTKPKAASNDVPLELRTGTDLRTHPTVLQKRDNADEAESSLLAKKARIGDDLLSANETEKVPSVSTNAGSVSESVQDHDDDDSDEKRSQSNSSTDQEDDNEIDSQKSKEDPQYKNTNSGSSDEDSDEGLRGRLDSEELNLEDAESPEEESIRRIIAAAAANGIPLEYLAAYGIHLSNEDDGPVEYPFEEPPTSLDDVANFIQSEKCNNILCLTGAGMSVASGIPDFRSSNGLYATLDATRLTATQEQIEAIQENPSFSLDQHLFLENPLPCLEVNREFILGVQDRKWKATLAHRFIEFLQTKLNGGKGKLVRLYTQNIDGLEDQCPGIGHQLRIAVHGSMDEAECANCHAKMDFNHFCELVRRQIKDITGQDPSAPKESRAIICESCSHNTVKPSIVLFRSRLPDEFFNNVPNDVEDIDLLIIMGTSLAVAPANSIVWRIPKSAMRVLINRERVGRHLGFDCRSNDRDFFARGDCENVALDLMEKLGWLGELRPLLEQNELPESSAKLLKERLESLERKPAPKPNEPQKNESLQQEAKNSA
jgi:NAD-dependent SIR2 family protein deacetylase